jgi:GST-like protein
MITLYTWDTPNAHKVTILLEECGLSYTANKIDLDAGQNGEPWFIALNPNGKVPVLIDDDGPDGKWISLFGSGAILVYFASKTGKFLPKSDHGKFEALQWLMFQMGGVGPMFSEAEHYLCNAPQPEPYPINRYSKETARLYGVLDKRLSDGEYLAGEYSIADIATYPWVARHDKHRIDLSTYPAVRRWFEKISTRPAVKRGMAIPE